MDSLTFLNKLGIKPTTPQAVRLLADQPDKEWTIIDLLDEHRRLIEQEMEQKVEHYIKYQSSVMDYAQSNPKKIGRGKKWIKGAIEQGRSMLSDLKAFWEGNLQTELFHDESGL